jgi:hypothetical protein
MDKEGKITFDIGKVPIEYLIDPGIQLLEGLTNGSEQYQYNVADNATVGNYNWNTGSFTTQNKSLIGEGENGIMNASLSYHGPDLYGVLSSSQYVPNRTGKDSEVTISSNVHWLEPSKPNYKRGDVTGWVSLSRSSIVFHELKEALERTSGGKMYVPSHNEAINVAIAFFLPGDPRYAINPGVATRR